jgi:hypothetical protein
MPARARITAIVKRIAFVPNAINFESLKAAAGGNLKPPPVHTKTMTLDIQQVFKQFAIYPLIFVGKDKGRDKQIVAPNWPAHDLRRTAQGVRKKGVRFDDKE